MRRLLENISRLPLVGFLRERWKGERSGVRLLLLLIMAASACWLVFGMKPWINGVKAAEAAGKDMRATMPFVVDGSYYAAGFNFVVAGLLLAGVRWLARPCGDVPGGQGEKRGLGRAGWIALWASVVLAAGVFARYAAPRLTYSLWVDEETTARQLIFGNYARVDARGKGNLFGERVVVKPVSWSETVWFFRTPNNHPFFSMTARASHTLVSKISPPAPLHFREWPLRLPAFLAALGTLGVLAVFLVRLGFPSAAMIVPLLVALHPWFVRFGSDARGYSLAFLFEAFCALMLWRALQNGRWRYWSALAVFQCLLVWSHPSGVYFLVALNLWGFLAPWVWKPALPRDEALARNGRLFLASSVSAMLFIQIFLPNVLGYNYRLQEIGEEVIDAQMARMGWEKIRNMLTWFAGGSAWSGFDDPEHPFSFTLPGRFGGVTPGLMLFLVAVAIVFGFGVGHFWRRGGAVRWFVLVLLLPAPAMYVVSRATGFYLFDHYLLMALPWFLLVLGTGLAAIAGMAGRSAKARSVAACALGALAAVLFWWTGKPQRDAYASHSFEMNREAVERVRGSLDPAAPGYHDVITAGLLRFPRTYDPYCYSIKSAKDIDRLIGMSEAEEKPLFIYCGMNAYGMPIAAELKDSSRFIHVAHYYGLDGMAELDVYRHDPGAVPAS